MKVLNATLTYDRNGMPLAQIESALGNGMECNAAGLRELANAINAIATLADAMPQPKQRKDTLKNHAELVWHPFA
ncbi:MAG: hypothetical protein NT086_11200 [Proteobacteria bacterium]|nr:hypothetical protein [Pseudomonadota bacterium]